MSTPSKFGQLTSGTTVKRYSGGPLDDNFKVIGKPMWSPYQIRSDESKDVKTTFEFFTKEKKKLYKGPDGDPTTSLTLPELCHHVFNDAKTEFDILTDTIRRLTDAHQRHPTDRDQLEAKGTEHLGHQQAVVTIT
jgi:hypothetical protein